MVLDYQKMNTFEFVQCSKSQCLSLFLKQFSKSSVQQFEAKNMVFEFDDQQVNIFEFVRCSKNNVRVRLMFYEMVFNTSLQNVLQFCESQYFTIFKNISNLDLFGNLIQQNWFMKCCVELYLYPSISNSLQLPILSFFFNKKLYHLLISMSLFCAATFSKTPVFIEYIVHVQFHKTITLMGKIFFFQFQTSIFHNL